MPGSVVTVPFTAKPPTRSLAYGSEELLHSVEHTLRRLRPNLPLVLPNLRPAERDGLMRIQWRQVPVLHGLDDLIPLLPQLLLQHRNHEYEAQWSMEKQVSVSFHFSTVLRIQMYRVSIERQSTEAEEELRVGCNGVSEVGFMLGLELLARCFLRIPHGFFFRSAAHEDDIPVLEDRAGSEIGIAVSPEALPDAVLECFLV